MRVTHIITRLIVGGAQENTVSSVNGLKRDYHHDLTLISGPPGSGIEGSLEDRLDPGVLRIIPELVREVHPWKDWLALQKLTRQLRDLKPQIVHTHSGKAGVLGRLAAAKARVPLILHTIHGPSFGPFQGKLSNTVFRAAERRAGKVTDHFVVVADAMKQQYLAAGIGSDSQYTRILSGFDLQPFLDAENSNKVRQQLRLGEEDLVIGMVARLCELKGHDDLFAVIPGILEKKPSARFLLVGDGPWRDRLEKKANAMGISSCLRFSGLVRPDEVPKYIGVMNILTHLSYREGLPRALPQALAAGKPVIAYDCDGAAEVCLNGRTGFLVRPGDLDELQLKLLQLASSPELRNRLGLEGCNLVKHEFSEHRMVRTINDLYRRLATEKGLAP